MKQKKRIELDDIPDAEYDRRLVALVADLPAEDLLAIEGVREAFEDWAEPHILDQCEAETRDIDTDDKIRMAHGE